MKIEGGTDEIMRCSLGTKILLLITGTVGGLSLLLLGAVTMLANLETDRTLEGVTLTDQELARLRGDLASGSGTLEFQDGHSHQVVLTVQHIMEVVINDEEEARPPGD